jgi:hypothetical protein
VIEPAKRARSVGAIGVPSWVIELRQWVPDHCRATHPS